MLLGDSLAIAQFYTLIGQQAQAPSGMSLRSGTARQGSDQSPLFAINARWTTRLWLIFKAVQSTLPIVVKEGSYGRVSQSQHPTHFFDGLAFMQLQQGGDPLEYLTSHITLM